MNTRHQLFAIVAVLVLGCSPSTVAPPARNGAPASNDAPAAKNAPVTASAQAPPTAADDSLVQFSLLAALAADDYAGGAPLRAVLAAGDFGLGTFDRLDGEMIVLDGKMYQALADGTVRAADLDGTTPFAAVTFFSEDGRVDNLSAVTLSNLEQQIDRQLPRPNSPYALCITGEFAELTLRSVPAQSPPFQALVDVVKHQVTWQRQNVRGTLIGLRCPPWMGTLNVSGYHWHFLSDDRQVGGHVLACQFDRGSLRFDECPTVVIHIPQSTEFDSFNISDVSQQDVDKIERQHAGATRSTRN